MPIFTLKLDRISRFLTDTGTAMAIGCSSILVMASAHANDSTGYIATGGVQYLKSNNISMHSEDLYISKDKIRVNYEFKNLSNKDITETVLFPLPALATWIDGDFADTAATTDNFKIWSDGRLVEPQVHVRTYMTPLIREQGRLVRDDTRKIDTTEIFKACGITDREMMGPWLGPKDNYLVNQKLRRCDNDALSPFIDYSKDEDFESYVYWESQIIYSWQQTFKANAITKVQHAYAPLVGDSVDLDKSQYAQFCVDKATSHTLSKNSFHYYRALSYILTTGANWAKPIGKFKLTVERDPDELVSFCWKGNGKVKKVGPTTFEVKEINFVPTHDFDVAFILR